MIMVSIGTFDWASLKTLRVTPLTDSTVMIVTVATVVLTHNLAIGVFAGIVLSAIFFAAKISNVHVTNKISADNNKKTYVVKGQLFFASVTELLSAFDYKEAYDVIEIDFSQAHIWDDSAVAAIDKIVIKYRESNVQVKLFGLNEPSAKLVDTLAVHKKPGAKLSSH
jgi:SulP family sulfate permease